MHKRKIIKPPRLGLARPFFLVLLCTFGTLLPGYAQTQITTNGSETLVNQSDTTNSQHLPRIAANSQGDYLVVWTSQSNTLDSDGAGVMVRGLDANGSTLISESLLNTSNHTGSQSHADVAINDNQDYVVAWMTLDGEGTDVDGFAIRHTAKNVAGTTLNNQVITNTTTTGQQRFPAVAIAQTGTYAIVWESDGDIMLQVYDATGSTLGSETVVNTSTDSLQTYPDVAMDANGNLVVVWQSMGQDGDGAGIYGQRFDSTGTAQGSQFSISSTTSGDQLEPRVAMDSNGNFTVVWSDDTRGTASDIYAQNFYADGSTNGSNYRVNSNNSDNQLHPDVSMTPDGHYAIVWASWGQDDDQSAVKMQVYNFEGDTKGGELQVNTNEQDYQTLPTVAFGEDQGELYVAWQDGANGSSTTQEGSEYGIFMQAYAVEDIEDPVVVVQDVTVYLDNVGDTRLYATDIENGSSDNVGIVSYSIATRNSYLDCGDVGTNNVTLTVTDSAGNEGTAVAVVTVLDTLGPTAGGRDKTIYLDATGSASISVNDISNGTSTDNCGVTLSLPLSDFSCDDVGANTVGLVGTDPSGNTDTAWVTVTVLDTISPSISAVDITVYLEESGSVLVNASDLYYGATDTCSISSVVASDSLFTCDNIGVNLVAVTAYDGSSNATTVTANVTVIDGINPTAVSQDITVYLDGTGSATVAGVDVDGGSSDNCSIVNYSLSDSTFSCSDLGANTVTFYVYDASGNIDTTSASITVLDTTAPSAVAQALTVYLDDTGNATISGNAVDGGSSDNCSFTSTLSETTFDCADIGERVVLFTATDDSGNSDSTSVSITVVDSVSPVVTASDATIVLDASGNATLSISDISGSATDNCTVDSTYLDRTAFACIDIGTTTITLTAVDQDGNTSSVTVNVTIDGGANFSSSLDCGNLELLGNWPLDHCEGTTISNSVGSNGTLNGGTWISGYRNQNIEFNGSSDYANLGPDSTLSFQSTFSLAMWVNTTEAGAYKLLMGKNMSGGNRSWELYIHNGEPTMYLGGMSSPGPYLGKTNVADGTWHHVAATMDSTGTLRLYVDGNLDRTVNEISGTIRTNYGADVTLGARLDLIGYTAFDGFIDEVKAYSDALSDAQVAELANTSYSPVACGASVVDLAAYWSLDGCNTTTVTEEISGTSNGLIQNGSEYLPGFDAQGLQFDGVNDYADLNDSTLTLGDGDAFTYSFWVYPHDNSDFYQSMITRSNSSGWGPILQLHYGEPVVYLGGLVAKGPYGAGVTISENSWSQITTTYESGTLKIYVNGTLSRTVNGLSGSINFDNGSHRLGLLSTTASGYKFDGMLDEIRFFDMALTEEAALAEYTRISYAPAECVTSPIGVWKFDDCNSSVAVDSMGQNNGVFFGPTRAAGYDNAGVSFDGSNDYINTGTGSELELTDEFTIALWVNPASHGIYKTMLAKGRNETNHGYYVQVHNGVPTMYLGGTIGSSYFASSSIPTNSWSHLAFTFSNGIWTAYINGVQSQQITNISGALTANSGTEFWMGMRPDASGVLQYHGSLDDVRIYDVALEASDISTMASLSQNTSDCSVARDDESEIGLQLNNQTVTVYPNPNQGSFTLLWDYSPEPVQIVLSNAVGQTVYRYQGDIADQRISVDLDRPSPGMYFMTVIEGAERSVYRIVIE